MKAVLYALGQQSEVELGITEGLQPEAFMRAKGYVVGSWFENEEFEIYAGERDEQPAFMICVVTGFSANYFLAKTVLDYAEIMGKFSSVTPLKVLEHQPDWARS